MSLTNILHAFHFPHKFSHLRNGCVIPIIGSTLQFCCCLHVGLDGCLLFVFMIFHVGHMTSMCYCDCRDHLSSLSNLHVVSPVVFFSVIFDLRFWWTPLIPSRISCLLPISMTEIWYDWLLRIYFETYYDKSNQIYMQMHTDWSVTCKESFHKGTNNNYVSDILVIDEHHEERTLRSWLTDYKHI